TYHIPILSQIKPTHTFRFRPESKPKKIFVMGTFNNWHRSNTPMHDADSNGVYEASLALDAGRYQYEFVVDGKEVFDPKNPVKVPNGFGYFNSIADVPSRHPEKALLHRMGSVKQNSRLHLHFAYERESQPGPLTHEQIIALLNNRKIGNQNIAIAENRIEIKLDLQKISPGNVLRLTVTQDGHTTPMQTVFLGNQLPEKQSFSTWHDAIMYSIMIDRFADGDPGNNRPVAHPELSEKANYLGGDLQGVLAKLETGYFDSLSVNVLWLSPVNQNTDKAHPEWPPPHRYFSAYHGYWPIHHQKIDPRYGDLELLKKLVDAAHAHGIKVILDFIANHVHENHPFFQQYRDWFGSYELPAGRKNIRLWDEFRLTTWFEPFLPSFDYPSAQAALDTMTDNAIWWLEKTGIDGFRQDAVKHIPGLFWRTLTQKIKHAFPDRKIYQIGETFGGYDLVSSYVNNGQLDAQFNFNLYDVAKYVFLSPEANFSILDAELQRTFSVYGPNHLMGNVMDSHDKVRFMAFADGDVSLDSGEAIELGWANPPEVTHAQSYQIAQLYLAYLMTIPGIPTLYYGDEIGMTGAADPDNRRMMRFGDALFSAEKDMLTEVQKIVRLRREHPALRTGDFQTLLANENCFVFLRSEMNERILVALNKSKRIQRLQVTIPVIYQSQQALDVLSRRKSAISNDTLSILLHPLGWSMQRID
ncbi:MAG: alpha-amylase family glycosyl hydrolase, partial [bacterium]